MESSLDLNHLFTPAVPKDYSSDGQLSSLRRTIDEALIVGLENYPHKNTNIIEAALYSLKAGGHRWRPILFLNIYRSLTQKTDVSAVLSLACAVEYLHTSSIILDDTPAMDDSQIRRGKKTCHRVFTPGVAILAASWLCDVTQHLIHEFQAHCAADICVLETLLRATKNEMIAGQVDDLRSIARSEAEILEKSRQKSGALYGFTAALPAWSMGNERAAEHLTRFGNSLGIAYQLVDDLHDMTGTQTMSGKDVDKDSKMRTIPRMYGIARTLELVDHYKAVCNYELLRSGCETAEIVGLVDRICA